jgi:D-amino peptidase
MCGRRFATDRPQSDNPSLLESPTVKVFISVDMEGISGLVRWADVVTSGIDFERNRGLMTLDANAAVAGAFDAGATDVVVEENHGVEDLCDLLIDEVDPRCHVVRGAGRPGATTMAALDSEIGVVLLVGHHARAGSRLGIMAHTISYEKFRSVRVNGSDCGEPEIFAIRAGELGVPVGMLSGDQVATQQLCQRAPWPEAVVVKTALSNVSGDVVPPSRARAWIRSAAQRAVERAARGELQAYRDEAAPYAIEVGMRQPIGDGLRENLDSLDEFEIVDEHTVRTVADDMDLGFRRIAYLGFGDRPGMTRY